MCGVEDLGFVGFRGFQGLESRVCGVEDWGFTVRGLAVQRCWYQGRSWGTLNPKPQTLNLKPQRLILNPNS